MSECRNLMPDAPECLHRGHMRLGPGVYTCADDHLHIIGPELCRAAGYAPTKKNIETLTRAALEIFKGEGEVHIVE